MQTFLRQHIDLSKLPSQVIQKWSSPVLIEGFVPFPKKLVRCIHRIFPGEDSVKEIAALMAIVDFKRPSQTRQPSLAYLAFLAGLEEGEFSAALGRLQSKSLIRVEGHSEGLEVSLQGLLERVENETK